MHPVACFTTSASTILATPAASFSHGCKSDLILHYLNQTRRPHLFIREQARLQLCSSRLMVKLAADAHEFCAPIAILLVTKLLYEIF